MGAIAISRRRSRNADTFRHDSTTTTPLIVDDKEQTNDEVHADLVLKRAAVSLGAILAMLLGFFGAQLGDLYVELSREQRQDHWQDDDGTGASPIGRGVTRIQIDWRLEGYSQSDTNQDYQSESYGIIKEALTEKIGEVRGFVERNEPFVCRRCMAEQSLGGWWDVDSNLLDAIGKGTYMPVRVATLASACSSNGTSAMSSNPTHFQRLTAPGSQGKDRSAYREKNMTALEFLEGYRIHDGRLDANESEHWYAAQVDVIKVLPGLLKYVIASSPPKRQMLEAIGPTPPSLYHPITLYFGAGERTTQLHYDSLENFCCLVSGGRKEFSLYDPASSAKYLYADRSIFGNGSPVIPSNPGPDHPLAKYALASHVSLQPGDCLYLPVYWYHTVTSSDERSISINWWRRADHEKMKMLENLFCGEESYGAEAKC